MGGKTRTVRPDPPLRRSALLPVALVLSLGLFGGGVLPFGFALLSASPLVLAFLLSPLWVAASARAFDRDAVGLLVAGRQAELMARYRRAVGLRLFGPLSVREERRGMIHLENGDPAEAQRHFQRAFEGWQNPEHAPFGLKVGYAHACYRVGDDAAAIVAYSKVLEERGALPSVRKGLAHALIREGSSLRDALTQLDRADAEASQPTDKAELAHLRAWALHAMGQKKKARRLLRDTDDVGTDITREARAACARPSAV